MFDQLLEQQPHRREEMMVVSQCAATYKMATSKFPGQVAQLELAEVARLANEQLVLGL